MTNRKEIEPGMNEYSSTPEERKKTEAETFILSFYNKCMKPDIDALHEKMDILMDDRKTQHAYNLAFIVSISIALISQAIQWIFILRK